MKAELVKKIDLILSDPSTSQWMRDSLRTALGRDPVDAANDAELLAKLLAEAAEPPDFVFTFTFTARPKGSSGRLYDCEMDVIGKEEGKAALKLYDKYEHITLHGKPKVKQLD